MATVRQVIDSQSNGSCSTAAVKGLSLQIIDEMNLLIPNVLVRFDDLNIAGNIDDTVNPFLQPNAKNALRRAIQRRGNETLMLTSAYRTIVQQHLLRSWYEQRKCNIRAAALPGQSNHEDGLAIDTPDFSDWRNALEAEGWDWLGDVNSKDPFHFTFMGAGVRDDIGSIGIKAFQILWNKYNPSDLIAEDGLFGPETAARLNKSPSEGFAARRFLRLTDPLLRGDDVLNVQQALVKFGLLSVDKINGIYDRQTQEAVKKYQEQKGLDIDGIVGLSTQRALKTLSPTTVKLQDIYIDNLVVDLDALTSNSELVRQIQIRLSALGLLLPSDVDGLFGPITEEALRRFCEAFNLNNTSTRLFGRIFAKTLIEARSLPPITVQPLPNGEIVSGAFTRALTFTSKWEGGFVNHPRDPGGATNKGIIQVVYDSYRIRKGLPSRSVRNITDDEVHEIYFTQYWKPSQAGMMVLPLAVAHFDTAVNFGVAGAIKFLQEALRIPADGIFGPRTQSALADKNNLMTAKEIIEGRISFRYLRVKQDRSQEVFLKGWLNRDNDLKAFVRALA